MADVKDGKQPHTAVPLGIKKLQLKEEDCSKLSMHIARKCLEVKLHQFPWPVQRSIVKLHQALSQEILCWG